MDLRRHNKTRPVLALALFIACLSTTQAQEQPADQPQKARSSKVGFVINNTPDGQAPAIKLITPPLDQINTHSTDKQELNIIVEVKDESPLKFASLNGQMQQVNEHGLFTAKIELEPGENILRFTAMDMADNLAEHQLTIDYKPKVVSLSARIKKESKYFALLIGIDRYRDEGIPDLDNPIRDAKAFHQTLTEHYTFAPGNVSLLKNPTRSDIISALDALRLMVGPDDNLLIFYAGHGYWDEDGRIGYWLPSDATRASTVDWFRNSTLVDYIQAIDSRHTLLITDACFGGSIFKARSVNMDEDLAYGKIYDLPSRKAMTSGTLTEVPDQSAFVKYLIQRLKENEETYLTSEQLFSNIRVAVISNSDVMPRYGEIQNVGNEGGDFIFLKKE